MDAKLLAKAALRVLAVFMFATGIMALPQLASMNYLPDMAEFVSLITATVMLGAPLLIGLVIWMLAPRIAGWVVGKVDAASAPVPADAANIQAIAFVTVGMVLAIQAGSYVLAVIYVLFTSPEMSGSLAHSYVLPAQIAKLVLGLVLLGGARIFTRLLQRVREF